MAREDECFACFSDDCDSCEGCDCSHASGFSDPRPKGCTSCSYTRTRYANAYTLRVDHVADCPNRTKAGNR